MSNEWKLREMENIHCVDRAERADRAAKLLHGETATVALLPPAEAITATRA
jgi:hypothetical protein